MNAAQLPSHIQTQDFGHGRLYVKFRPTLVSLLDSEWTPEELFAIAADIAQRSASAGPPHAVAVPAHQSFPVPSKG